MAKISKICEKCGSIDTEKQVKEGSHKPSQLFLWIIISFILMLFMGPFAFVILAIAVIYIAFSKPLKHYSLCTSCDGENTFIKIDTPKGQQLKKQYHSEQ